MTTTKNLSTLLKEIKSSDVLKQRLLENPVAFLEGVTEEPPMNNLWVFIVIVGIVAIVLISSMVMAFNFLSDTANTTGKVPDFLISISSTALGAIVGLLAPTPGRN